jgi:BetI-type transcriptional repressor, C-terminal
VRHGRQTGEFDDGEDADEIGRKLGALIDGLAIQVLMNDTQVSPEHMQRMCQEVAASLIGFELEPATSA